MKALVLSLTLAAAPSFAFAQAKPLHCVVDGLTQEQREVIGANALTGQNQEKASAYMEGATATCSTKLTPVQVNAAVQYASDASTLAAANAQLKAMGAAAGLIDTVWQRTAEGHKDIADQIKAGSPPAAVIDQINQLAPKGDNAQPAAIAVLMGLTAKASLAAADAGVQPLQ